jgi:hypothetical protein
VKVAKEIGVIKMILDAGNLQEVLVMVNTG